MIEVRVRPCAPADILQLWPQTIEPSAYTSPPSAAEAWRYCTPRLSLAGDAGGVLQACGGVLPEWPGRATGWLLVRQGIPRRFWPVVRRVARELLSAAQSEGYRRIEARVHERFSGGIGFLRGLGFDVEAYRPAFWPSGAGAFDFVLLEAEATT